MSRMTIIFIGDWVPHKRRDYCFVDGMPIGNLECAFADGDVANDKAYESVLPTACLDNIEAAGFAALSVANNHVYDAGANGFDFMITELERRGIRHFGTCDKPYVELDIGDKKIAVIGCLEPCRSRGGRIFKQEDVASLIKRIRGEFDKVYVYPHWGKEGEYTRYPSPMQRRLAHHWIDVGANGVLGNHAHVPQGMEWYNGMPIYYSIGNFDFPLGEIETCPESKDRMIVKIDLSDGVHQTFDSPEAEDDFRKASSILGNQWNLWTWAKEIGPINLAKNMDSWNVRLKKNFWKTLPKFLVWQILPKVLLFRLASMFNDH